MKIIALVVAFLTGWIVPAAALDAGEIRKLAAEPHDRANLVPELKMFAEAREYKVTEKNGPPGEELAAGPEVRATEKTVAGRYIVTEVPGAAGAPSFVTVVAFEKGEGVFKKWILTPDGILAVSTGVADLGKRSIAWVTEAGDTTVLGLEVHADDRTTWKGSLLQDGKVVRMIEGLAVRLK